MIKKKNSTVIQFPSNLSEGERQVEAILFAAEEPLDIESIQIKMNKKANIEEILLKHKSTDEESEKNKEKQLLQEDK